MATRALHIVFFTIFALLFVVERGLPCLDDCLAQENDPCAREAVSHVDVGATSDDAETHHCDHCSCICHVPAINVSSSIVDANHAPSPLVAIHRTSVPTAPVSPPDHIPLV